MSGHPVHLEIPMENVTEHTDRELGRLLRKLYGPGEYRSINKGALSIGEGAGAPFPAPQLLHVDFIPESSLFEGKVDILSAAAMRNSVIRNCSLVGDEYAPTLMSLVLADFVYPRALHDADALALLFELICRAAIHNGYEVTVVPPPTPRTVN